MTAVVIALLAVAAGLLLGKVLLMRRAAREMAERLSELLAEESNTLISISSRDGAMRALAEGLNGQLRVLREQRRRFTRGDRELKEAVTAVAHDLRTPLTAIRGYLDLLGHEPLTENARRYVAQIEGRAEMLTRLSEELFRYSVAVTSGKLTPERVDLRAALEESLLSLGASALGRGVEPCVSLPDAPVFRLLDAQALSRVLSNVLNNALVHGDGDLCVRMDASGEIRIANGARRLNGVDVERLFDRFYTVETGRGSTGLGLYIAKALAERMGGAISAAHDGERLTVTLRFPEGGGMDGERHEGI